MRDALALQRITGQNKTASDGSAGHRIVPGLVAEEPMDLVTDLAA